MPAPNFVLESPGKHQIVWSVEGLELQEAESILGAIAAEVGGDPAAADATRGLRLPGFANRKYGEEFIVVPHQETIERYQARDFQLPESSSVRSRHVVRGDDPQEIMRRIARFPGRGEAEARVLRAPYSCT